MFAGHTVAIAVEIVGIAWVLFEDLLRFVLCFEVVAVEVAIRGLIGIVIINRRVVFVVWFRFWLFGFF